MKIKKIETALLEAPLKTPFVTSLRRVDRLEDLLVVIECDDGTRGYGEGAPTPAITGETIGSIKAAIDLIAPFLIGREIEDFDTLLMHVHTHIVKNSTAKSALEIALYDLRAKYLKLPLYRMLGGTKRVFETDITISMGETGCMVADALDAVKRGYTSLKIKIGDNPHKDAQRIIAIWSALPETVKLRLDANQGWTAEESVSLLQKIEKKGIIAECIEQPVAAGDIEGFSYIKERVETPLLADESVFSLNDARRLLEREAVDYINIKLAKTGGIFQALALADLSASYGVKCMMGCMLEGPVSVTAGVHVASAKADTISLLDLDAVTLLSSHPVSLSVQYDESSIVLSEESGLGIQGLMALHPLQTGCYYSTK